MKEIKKYTSIVRYGKSGTGEVIKEGDIISITEKVDGANASFTYDVDNELGVSCYSRNNPLGMDNTLQGYYGWVRENIVPIKDKLVPHYRYIGEWTTPHKVRYKEEWTKIFLLFSIWDEEQGKYLHDKEVISEAERLGLNTVEYFYYGPFVSYEHMSSFIGKSNITLEPDTGEGIVIKNADYFDNMGKQVFVKLVSEKFAELQKQKLPKNPNINEKEVAAIMTVLTPARVDKMLHKLVDDGVLTRDEFKLEYMGKLIKSVSNLVIEDMLKEEPEILANIEFDVLKKHVGKKIPLVIKQVLKDYEV